MARNGVKNSSLLKKCETSSLGVVFSVEFKNNISFQIRINFKVVSGPIIQQNAKFLISPHLNWRQIVIARELASDFRKVLEIVKISNTTFLTSDDMNI